MDSRIFANIKSFVIRLLMRVVLDNDLENITKSFWTIVCTLVLMVKVGHSKQSAERLNLYLFPKAVDYCSRLRIKHEKNISPFFILLYSGNKI